MSATRGSAVNEDLEELDMKVVLLGLGVVLMMLGLASTTTARSDADREVVRVEPATVDAGGSVTIAGTGMPPGSARTLVLAGGHLVIGLGAVRTMRATGSTWWSTFPAIFPRARTSFGRSATTPWWRP
jgi:hypothetical protein